MKTRLILAAAGAVILSAAPALASCPANFREQATPYFTICICESNPEMACSLEATPPPGAPPSCSFATPPCGNGGGGTQPPVEGTPPPIGTPGGGMPPYYGTPGGGEGGGGGGYPPPEGGGPGEGGGEEGGGEESACGSFDFYQLISDISDTLSAGDTVESNWEGFLKGSRLVFSKRSKDLWVLLGLQAEEDEVELLTALTDLLENDFAAETVEPGEGEGGGEEEFTDPCYSLEDVVDKIISAKKCSKSVKKIFNTFYARAKKAVAPNSPFLEMGESDESASDLKKKISRAKRICDGKASGGGVRTGPK